jgi:tetratricopeptide (TPR) repeat protein
MSMNDGDSQRALDRLKEALAITRDLGDRAGETDVTGNFGLLSLTLGDARLAAQLFERELGFARACGDRFAEKTALEHLGLARARLNDHTRALQMFDEALSVARTMGDRQHEATLTWQKAVQYAELGQRDRAIEEARSAIAMARELDSEQAELLASHLQRYCDSAVAGLSAPVDNPPTGEAIIGGAILVSAAVSDPARSQDRVGAGLLRKGLSAARSVTRFVASGLKLTDSDLLKSRLELCASCEHHTGLRCKVCGCFTNVKTRMAAETCPAGKWPGERSRQ